MALTHRHPLIWSPVGFGAALALACAAAGHGQVTIVGDAPAAQAPASAVRAPSAPRSMTPDEATMLEARRLLAAKEAGKAKDVLDAWLSRNAGGQSPQLPEAYYLRGNAKLANGDEYDALYDYEEVIKNYPASEFFVTSLEREFDVAKLYYAGRKRPGLFGIRLDSGASVGHEIITRINERMPGSKLAERALMTMADYYARTRDLPMAVEVYDTFVKLYPRSQMRGKAMQRRAYATVAQFKGPAYDASVLTDASIQVENFQAEFPGAAQEAGLTDGLQARLDESTAASLLYTARWYLRRDDPISARLTLVRLIKRHPRTASAQEALTLVQTIDKDFPAIAGAAPATTPEPAATADPSLAPAQTSEPAPKQSTPTNATQEGAR